MFKSVVECIGNIYVQHSVLDVDNVSVPLGLLQAKEDEIQLRDYQNDAVRNCLNDLVTYRSSLLVLATGLGKTILFSKIIKSWKGRVLVLVHLEELLQNAYSEIEQITGEVLGIERGPEHNLGERIVVGTIQTVSRKLDKFSNEHFTLVICDEAHHCSSRQYLQVFDHFRSAKIIGLTATDARADGQRLPFDTCSYRMGIREGIEQGYLVPIRGKRIVIDKINLSRVKQTESGDFDDEALDDEMVKGASAIADVIASDYAFDKGILFFPGCSSAKLTSELLNKRLPGISVYIDGKITGPIRRNLVSQLRNGNANWLCNVGIATEGFNWPEASVIVMCVPTLSRSAYVQRAGRGTRPLAGLLNGLSSTQCRVSAISNSTKPYMTILDFVGVSASLNLISHESFLQPTEDINVTKEEKQKRERTDEEECPENREDSSERNSNFGLSRIASGIQSKTFFGSESFDPFEETNQEESVIELKKTFLKTDTLSEKQFLLLKRNGINDSSLTREEAQEMIKLIAKFGFRLNPIQRNILKALYGRIKKEGVPESCK